MISSHHFYDTTRTIFDIVCTLPVWSHPLSSWYDTNWIFEISSAIYDDIISIAYYITATECVSSRPGFQRYNTLCMQDITPTICIISYTLYKALPPHFMTSQHIIYDITCTVYMTSPPLYLKCLPPYLCHHKTLLMFSEQLYVWYHTHFTYASLCILHNLTSTLYDFKPL